MIKELNARLVKTEGKLEEAREQLVAFRKSMVEMSVEKRAIEERKNEAREKERKSEEVDGKRCRRRGARKTGVKKRKKWHQRLQWRGR